MKNKYYPVHKKYLADSLSFLGLNYILFKDNDIIYYLFEDTEKFRLALSSLTNLKNQLNQLKTN